MGLGISEAVELTGKIADLVKKGTTIGLQEQVMELREAVLNAKDEVLALREENTKLKEQASEKATWSERAAKYTLVKMDAGATVYRTDGPPEHYACPTCFEKRSISILQDTNNAAGSFLCMPCNKYFRIRVV